MGEQIKLKQNMDILKKLLRVAEPERTQSYYDNLWEEMRNKGSVQSRKHSKVYDDGTRR